MEAGILSQLVGKPLLWPDGAAVPYFLSDCDIVSDVQSPVENLAASLAALIVLGLNALQ
jgi:hypothetical protein